MARPCGGDVVAGPARYASTIVTHALAEERSLALHRAIVEKARLEPALIDRARARVESWGERGEAHPYYVEAWVAVLSKPIDDILDFLVDPGEHACALRQVTPFAGALTARERWRILAGVRKAS